MRAFVRKRPMWPEMTDERLEWLGDRFIRLQIRARTLATFEQYVERPEYYENLANIVSTLAGISVAERAMYSVDSGLN